MKCKKKIIAGVICLLFFSLSTKNIWLACRDIQSGEPQGQEQQKQQTKAQLLYDNDTDTDTGVSDWAYSMDHEWNLILVNSTHFVNQDYISNIKLTKLRNGQAVDERCYPDLQRMMDDCRKEGYSPIICSSFRTNQKQRELFKKQVSEYMSQGLSEQDAKAEAAKSVAIPGTSEHELGLAVDIADINNQNLISGMESQPVQQWLMENCWKYGFILRYPPDKSDITGIVYEPWHYRYVGYGAAKYIYENNLTLEEYLEAIGDEAIGDGVSGIFSVPSGGKPLGTEFFGIFDELVGTESMAFS